MHNNYNEIAQMKYIKYVMSLIDLLNEQSYVATKIFIKLKGHHLIESTLYHYLESTNTQLNELIKDSMHMNQDLIQTDIMYENVTTYSNNYYANMKLLQSTSDEFDKSNSPIELEFNKMYYKLHTLAIKSFNIASETYDIKIALQDQISSETQQKTRSNKLK